MPSAVRLAVTLSAASTGFMLMWFALDWSSAPLGIIGGLLFGSGVTAGVS